MTEKAVARSKLEGLDKHDRFAKEGGDYYGKPLEKFVMDRMSYYMCFKCKEPYFGGMKDCGQGGQPQQEGGGEFAKEDLVCGKCAALSMGGVSKCDTHGTDFIEFKCRFCCSISQWFCFGNTHFCEPCHNKRPDIHKDRIKKCEGFSKDPNCGLKADHPPNPSEYPLGCSMCRYK